MEDSKKNIQKFIADFRAKFVDEFKKAFGPIEDIRKQYTEAEWEDLSQSLNFLNPPKVLEPVSVDANASPDEGTQKSPITVQKSPEEMENDQIMAELSAKYGKPLQVIRILDNRLKNSFIMFPTAQCIYVQSMVIPYRQIVSCEVKDESYTTVTGSREEITKTSTGSMAGRAIAGGLIAGPLGAVIGGATAKKKTEVIDNTQTNTHHHYYVIVTLAGVSNSLARIDCGKSNPYIAERIKAALNGIISQKESTSIAFKSVADELAKLAVLKEQGILTDAEFAQQKQHLLETSTRPIEQTAEGQESFEGKTQGVFFDPVLHDVEEWLKAGMVQIATKKYQDGKGCSLEEAQDFIKKFRAERGL